MPLPDYIVSQYHWGGERRGIIKEWNPAIN